MKVAAAVKSIGVVSGLTIVTNLFGFIRELLMARSFGTGLAADAFVAAYSIVSVCFLVFSAGTVQSAFMPVYQGLVMKDQVSKARALFRKAMSALGVVLTVIVLLLMTRSHWWVGTLLPGFQATQHMLTSDLVFIMAPSVLFIGTGALLQSVSHAHGRFAGPALVPVFNNFVVILALLTVVTELGVVGVGYAYLLGALLWWVILRPTIAPHISGHTDPQINESTRRALKSFWPLLVLLSADQVSALLQKSIVSGLETGSIAALNYGAKLEALPVGLFAAAIATVFFPLLVHASSHSTASEVLSVFYKGFEWIVLLCLPASILLCLDGERIVRVLFERGSFTAESTAKTNIALFYYSLGLVAQGLIILVNRTYFAFAATRLPATIGTIMAAIHVLFCYVAVRYQGFEGIASGSTLYAWVYLFALLYFLRRLVPFSWSQLALHLIDPLRAMTVALVIFYPWGWLMMKVTDDLLGIARLATVSSVYLLVYFWLWRRRRVWREA